jgi:hypothetical protein
LFILLFVLHLRLLCLVAPVCPTPLCTSPCLSLFRYVQYIIVRLYALSLTPICTVVSASQQHTLCLCVVCHSDVGYNPTKPPSDLVLLDPVMETHRLSRMLTAVCPFRASVLWKFCALLLCALCIQLSALMLCALSTLYACALLCALCSPALCSLLCAPGSPSALRLCAQCPGSCSLGLSALASGTYSLWHTLLRPLPISLGLSICDLSAPLFSVPCSHVSPGWFVLGRWPWTPCVVCKHLIV